MTEQYKHEIKAFSQISLSHVNDSKTCLNSLHFDKEVQICSDWNQYYLTMLGNEVYVSLGLIETVIKMHQVFDTTNILELLGR